MRSWTGFRDPGASWAGFCAHGTAWACHFPHQEWGKVLARGFGAIWGRGSKHHGNWPICPLGMGKRSHLRRLRSGIAMARPILLGLHFPHGEWGKGVKGGLVIGQDLGMLGPLPAGFRAFSGVFLGRGRAERNFLGFWGGGSSPRGPPQAGPKMRNLI